MNTKCQKKYMFCLLITATILLLAFSLIQYFWAHRHGYFRPDYERVLLTEESDYETIFLQTGLGHSAADKLLAAGDFQTILKAQDAFFSPPTPQCTELLGWFTREDRLAASGTPLVDLQSGDILITLSTHSVGWRHGHAGLVIDHNTALECVVLGTDSTLVDTAHWSTYSNYAVLRLKKITPELQEAVTSYSLAHLCGVPYHLSAGFIGSKAPNPNASYFGLHCSYLVWYAWNHFGYDLDSDGGRLVSSSDLLYSDALEVVQVYGMDPRVFLPDESI